MAGTKYCHLCGVASATHYTSPRHRAARQIAAVAIERLGRVAACDIEEDPDVTEPTAESGDVMVSFCDCCNVTVPAPDITNHLRQINHTFALRKDQTFEELVRLYVYEEKLLEGPSDLQDFASVDQAKAVKTYTCNYCAMAVPLAFRTEHDRSARHRSSRALAISVARRIRDTLATSGDKAEDNSEQQNKSKDTTGDDSKDTSEDTPKDTAGDQSNDKSEDMDERPRLNSKMTRMLLRAYTGSDIAEDKNENTIEETDPTKTEPKRLTAKEYFKEILPYSSCIGTFHTLVINDTEFVTIQIGRDTLKIHVNNLNGLYNYNGSDGYYMNCRLCDGFDNKCYGSYGEHDKLHVMSLGHIRNVLSPFDNVHLIRKIDETHSTCALCNVQIPSHNVDHHIFKDLHHTTALAEAMERGKTFKDNNENLKIMVYSPPAHKPCFMKPIQFNNAQQWYNQNQGKSNNGTLFGSAQNNTFGNAQNFAGAQVQNNANVGWPQNHAAFGYIHPKLAGALSQNNANTAWAQNNAAFGSAQNNTFGSPQNFVGAQGQNNANTGWPRNNAGFGSAQGQNNALNIGLPQYDLIWPYGNTAFGNAQNSAGAQGQTNPYTGWAQNAASGSPQNKAGFSIVNNSSGTAQNPAGFGAQNKTTAFGSTQNNAVPFGNAQNTAGAGNQNKTAGFGTHNSASFHVNAQNSAGIGTAQNNAILFGSAQNTARFGAQNSRGLFGNAQNSTGFDTAQHNIASGESAQNPTGFGAQNKTVVGTTQNNAAPFGSAQNTAGFGAQKKPIGFGNAQKNTAPQNQTALVGQNLIIGYNYRANQPSSAVQNASLSSAQSSPSNSGNTQNNGVGAKNSTGLGCGDKTAFNNAQITGNIETVTQSGLINKAPSPNTDGDVKIPSQKTPTQSNSRTDSPNVTSSLINEPGHQTDRPPSNAALQLEENLKNIQSGDENFAVAQTQAQNISNSTRQDNFGNTQYSDTIIPPLKTYPARFGLSAFSSSSESE